MSTNDTGTMPKVKLPRGPRGFAAMDKAKLRELARKGGIAAHVKGTAHEFTTEEARAAGAKGGMTSHANKRAAANPTVQS